MMLKKCIKKLSNNIKIIDSTTITIDDNRTSWASYKKNKRGIKVHLMLNQGSIFPEESIITLENVS